jgi:hypothetical protein
MYDVLNFDVGKYWGIIIILNSNVNIHNSNISKYILRLLSILALVNMNISGSDAST